VCAERCSYDLFCVSRHRLQSRTRLAPVPAVLWVACAYVLYTVEPAGRRATTTISPLSRGGRGVSEYGTSRAVPSNLQLLRRVVKGATTIIYSTCTACPTTYCYSSSTADPARRIPSVDIQRVDTNVYLRTWRIFSSYVDQYHLVLDTTADCKFLGESESSLFFTTGTTDKLIINYLSPMRLLPPASPSQLQICYQNQ
jgi:hypothetical protein